MSYDPLASARVTPSLAMPDTYWHQTCSDTHTPDPLTTNVTTDVAVVGGGYTGLSTAYHLAKKGIATTLLDAHSPGFGCAGRNGGFLLPGTGRKGLIQLAEEFGEQTAKALAEEFNAAVTLVGQLVEKGNINCDWTNGPYYKVAYTQKEATKLAAHCEQLKTRFNQTIEYLDASVFNNTANISKAVAASVQPGVALHPLKLVYGYINMAERAGASLHYHSPVLSITKERHQYRLSTENGTVLCNRLILGTNAYSPKTLHAQIDNRQFPVQSSILVTNPLSQSQRDSTGLRGPMTMMDTRLMKYYYRLLPDGRLLFGGRGAVTGKGHDSLKSRHRLYRAMTSSFPQIRGIGVSHFWSGWVSISLDSLPRVYFDHDENIGSAMGYCGSGVAFSALAGKRLAQQATGEAINTDLPIYRGTLPAYPFPAFRRLGLHALYAWATVTNN